MSRADTTSAREAALFALLAIRKGGAYSSAAVKKAAADARLSPLDTALCQQIVFGVLQQKMYLDFLLSQFSSVKLKKLEDKVLSILRLSLYQIRFLDRVPIHAVLNEAVELTKRYAKNPRASGYVNGVLRAIDRAGDALPEPDSLSVRYSHPQELVSLWTEELGEEHTRRILKANNQTAPIMIVCNELVCTEQELMDALEQEKVFVEQTPQGLSLRSTGNLERLKAFEQGFFYVQDPAAHKAARLAGAKPGMDVLDLCAAPGGKSFSMAQDMQGQGHILACDIYEHKLELIRSGAKRLGFACIETQLSDATQRIQYWQERFDIVFADVPCSGLGIIRKKPEIRYKDFSDLSQLEQIQAAIMEHAAVYVKRGGVLLYATCTLRRAENEGAVEHFLERHGEYQLEESKTCYPDEGAWDGFYMAKLRRQA